MRWMSELGGRMEGRMEGQEGRRVRKESVKVGRKLGWGRGGREFSMHFFTIPTPGSHCAFHLFTIITT